MAIWRRLSRTGALLALVISLSLVAVGCAPNPMNTLSKNLYDIQGVTWTAPATPDQIKHCRAYLGKYKPPKNVSGSMKPAVVLQIGTRVQAHDIDLWRARVCTRGSDGIVLASHTSPYGTPVKNLQELEFIQPGALIAFKFTDMSEIKPSGVKILQKNFMKIGS